MIVARYDLGYRNSWNVELPVFLPIRQHERCGEVIEKVVARNFFVAERFAAS
jgi:hypothetical protein